MRRHILGYLLNRLFPAGISFFSLYLLGAYFSIEDYGKYAIYIAQSGIFCALFLLWFPKALIRFGSSNNNESNEEIKTIFAMYISATLVLILFFWGYRRFSDYNAFLIVLGAVAQSLKEGALEFQRANLKLFNYTLIQTGDALATIIALIYTIVYNDSITVFFVLSCSSSIIAGTLGLSSLLINFKIRKVNWNIGLKILRYAYPINLSSMITQVLFSGSRIVIDYKLGSAATGLFSLIYDYMQRSLVVVMGSINAAIYPYIQRAWLANQLNAMRHYEQVHWKLQVITGTFFISALYLNFDLLVLVMKIDSALKGVSLQLAVLLAIAVFTNRIRSFHYEMPFLLQKQTVSFIGVSVAISIAGIAMIFMFIEWIGIIGAGLAILNAYILGLILLIKMQKKLKHKFGIFSKKSIINACPILIYPIAVILAEKIGLTFSGKIFIQFAALMTSAGVFFAQYKYKKIN